jgi:hypothetical protein
MAEVPEDPEWPIDNWEPELPHVEPIPRNRKPTPRFIAEIMTDQGFTLMHFVQAYLKDFEIYNEEEETFMRVDDELYERIDEIIQGVIHGQAEFQHPVVAEPIESEPLVFNPSPSAVYDSDGEDGFLNSDSASDWTVSES